LYENIRQRMAQDEHVTLTLIRYESSGALTFAGAHEDILIHRAKQAKVEIVPTSGTWVGAVRDISHSTRDTACKLEPGDVLLLHTDGISEARNAAGEPFGIERLSRALERASSKPVQAIRDTILAELRAWTPVFDDDVTLLVARQMPESTRGT
jgi:serine phosphatase RsbU (regulator of sigma subunit)